MLDPDKVPEGATHYVESRTTGMDAFYRLDGGPTMTWVQATGVWSASAFKTNDMAIAMFGDRLKEIPMMKEESDLDWLARNVHKWPAGDHQSWCYVITHNDDSKRVSVVSLGEPEAPEIEKSEWLARRAELQKKPLWKDAPEWAEWLAQSPHGHWEWFGHKPVARDFWIADPAIEEQAAHDAFKPGAILGDWRDTLELRPAVIVPAAPLPGDADSWFERGDLPPFGVAVQLWHGGVYAYDCEFIAKRGHSYVLWNLNFDRADSAVCLMCEFRPIPNERQRTITGIVDIMIGTPANENMTATERLSVVAGVIYDKFISKKEGAS